MSCLTGRHHPEDEDQRSDDHNATHFPQDQDPLPLSVNSSLPLLYFLKSKKT